MHASFRQRLAPVPDLPALAARCPQYFPYLLESAARGDLGGFSLLLFADGEALLSLPGGEVTGPGAGANFFDRLEDWYSRDRVTSAQPSGDLPFVGGWFLFIGYEMAGVIEPRLELPLNRTGLPDAIAHRCRGAVIVQHGSDGVEDRAWLVAETRDVLDDMQSRLEQAQRSGGRPISVDPLLSGLTVEDPERFRDAVERIHEYLAAGDVFQVNISRRWDGLFGAEPDPFRLYESLRRANPAPFAGFMNWQGRSLLSSSPERLVQVQGDRAQTRPIAGTRPRGADDSQDRALSRELISNLKERAEHVMLIDLERNDLGRVCRPGSIEVNELMVVESYSHVHHIVSNVRGVLREDASPVDAVQAVFPGGTITGCPKVRCMEIIAELEQEGRGFYTGSMGYLGVDGRMDLNILIRSLLLDGRRFSFRTGAGIVADSVPEAEVGETEDKARGMLVAVETHGREKKHA